MVIFLTSNYNFDASMSKILIWRVIKVALFTLILENWESHSQFQSHFFLSELSFSFSTLNFSPKTLILILDSQIFSLEVSFSISTLSKLTLAEVWFLYRGLLLSDLHYWMYCGSGLIKLIFLPWNLVDTDIEKDLLTTKKWDCRLPHLYPVASNFIL